LYCSENLILAVSAETVENLCESVNVAYHVNTWNVMYYVNIK